MKPLYESHLNTVGALKIDLLDFTQHLVCEVKYFPQNKLRPDQLLEHMNLQTI